MSNRRGVPTLPDHDTINTYLAASGTNNCFYPAALYNFLKQIDLQDATNRYVWYNLPEGMDGELIERVLYFRGQGAFFYSQEMDKFFFLPYCLDGDIDVYGRYNNIVPLPFHGMNEDRDKEGRIIPFIPGMKKHVKHDVPMVLTLNDFLDGAVLLHDRSIGISQKTEPRVELNDPLVKMMSEAPAMARTNLLANSSVRAMKVASADEQQNVDMANNVIQRSALEGKPFVAVLGFNEFQDLSASGRVDTDQYMMYMQAIDNLRLSGYGLKNGGVFDKDSTYINNTQAANIQQNVGLVYQDGLNQRQKFCDIVNSIWQLGIWCDSSETVTNTDDDLNGKVQDDQDQSGIQGRQEEAMVGGEE